MYFPYGFPKALLTGVAAAEGAPIYLAASPGGDYVVAVFGAVLQVCSCVLRKLCVCLSGVATFSFVLPAGWPARR